MKKEKITPTKILNKDVDSVIVTGLPILDEDSDSFTVQVRLVKEAEAPAPGTNPPLPTAGNDFNFTTSVVIKKSELKSLPELQKEIKAAAIAGANLAPKK